MLRRVGVSGFVMLPQAGHRLPMGARETFLGVGVDVGGLTGVTVSVWVDPPSASGDLSLQFAADPSLAWNTAINMTVAGGRCVVPVVPLSRYFRAVYTNGPEPQAQFRLDVTGNDDAGLLTRLSKGRVTDQELRDVVPELVRIIAG